MAPDPLDSSTFASPLAVFDVGTAPIGSGSSPLKVSPEALQGLVRLLGQSAQVLDDLQTEPPLNIIGSELPGSDAARASTDVAIALTGAILGISGRMTAMAGVALANKLSRATTVTVTTNGSDLSQLYAMAVETQPPLDQYPPSFIGADADGHPRRLSMEEFTANASEGEHRASSLELESSLGPDGLGYNVERFKLARMEGAMGDGASDGSVIRIENQEAYNRLAKGQEEPGE